MNSIEIGKLLRSRTTGCVVGCRVQQAQVPYFGGMVRIPLDGGTQVFGLVYDIHIDDDGLVRQLVTAPVVDEAVIRDNRNNRNVPVEVSVLFIGYEQNGSVYHLLPPRPPLTLDAIFICDDAELCRFTSAGRFGYFRHILRSVDIPVGDLLAAHVSATVQAQSAGGNTAWGSDATRELITLLRDDYPLLVSVLGAISDTRSFSVSFK